MLSLKVHGAADAINLNAGAIEVIGTTPRGIGQLLLRMDDMVTLPVMTNVAAILNPEYHFSCFINCHGTYFRPTVAQTESMRWLIENGNEIGAHSAWHSFVGVSGAPVGSVSKTNIFLVQATGTDPRLTISTTTVGDSTNWTGTLTLQINGASTNINLVPTAGEFTFYLLALKLNGMALGDGVMTMTNEDTTFFTLVCASMTLANITNVSIASPTHLHVDPTAFYHISVNEATADLQSYIRSGVDRNGLNSNLAGVATGIASNYVVESYVAPYGAGCPDQHTAITNTPNMNLAANSLTQSPAYMDGLVGFDRYDMHWVSSTPGDVLKQEFMDRAATHYFVIWTAHLEGLTYQGSTENLKVGLAARQIRCKTHKEFFSWLSTNGYYSVGPTNIAYIGP
jgi:hypothetical protein